MIRCVLHFWSVTRLVALAVMLFAVGGCERSPQDLTEPTDTRAAQAGDEVESRANASTCCPINCFDRSILIWPSVGVALVSAECFDHRVQVSRGTAIPANSGNVDRHLCRSHSFKMPTQMKITGRLSIITNAFINSIIPVIAPNEEQVQQALAVL